MVNLLCLLDLSWSKPLVQQFGAPSCDAHIQYPFPLERVHTQKFPGQHKFVASIHLRWAEPGLDKCNDLKAIYGGLQPTTQDISTNHCLLLESPCLLSIMLNRIHSRRDLYSYIAVKLGFLLPKEQPWRHPLFEGSNKAASCRHSKSQDHHAWALANETHWPSAIVLGVRLLNWCAESATCLLFLPRSISWGCVSTTASLWPWRNLFTLPGQPGVAPYNAQSQLPKTGTTVRVLEGQKKRESQ